MTAPDPRLGEIEAEVVQAAAKAMFDVRDDPYDMDEWEDIDSTEREPFECQARAAIEAAYPILLAELRKAQDALGRVEGLHMPVDAAMYAGNGVHKVKVCTGCGTDDGNWQRWPCPTRRAAVAAATGGES